MLMKIFMAGVAVIHLCLVPAGLTLARTFHAAFGLVPSETYNLSRDGSRQAELLQSDAAGHVGFSCEGDGVFRIEAQGRADRFRPASPDSLWGEWDGQAVILRWPASPDSQTVAYQVDRRRLDRDDSVRQVQRVFGLGWRDTTAVPLAVYAYSVRADGRSGETPGCDAAIIVSTTIPRASPRGVPLGLFPNPTAGRLRVAFSLDAPAPVEVWFTELSGRCVGTRRLGLGQPGANVWALDLTEPGGPRLAAGSYFVVCRSGSRQSSARLTVLPGR